MQSVNPEWVSVGQSHNLEAALVLGTFAEMCFDNLKVFYKQAAVMPLP